jgi:hypothetical protein
MVKVGRLSTRDHDHKMAAVGYRRRAVRFLSPPPSVTRRRREGGVILSSPGGKPQPTTARPGDPWRGSEEREGSPPPRLQLRIRWRLNRRATTRSTECSMAPEPRGAI